MIKHVLTIDNSDDDRFMTTIGSDRSIAVWSNMADTTLMLSVF